jgi:hypothetical protein
LKKDEQRSIFLILKMLVQDGIVKCKALESILLSGKISSYDQIQIRPIIEWQTLAKHFLLQKKNLSNQTITGLPEASTINQLNTHSESHFDNFNELR